MEDAFDSRIWDKEVEESRGKVAIECVAILRIYGRCGKGGGFNVVMDVVLAGSSSSKGRVHFFLNKHFKYSITIMVLSIRSTYDYIRRV